MPEIRVLIVDDDPLVRTALSHFVSRDSEIEVIGEAPAGFVGREAPDAIFIGGGLTEEGLFDAAWAALKPGGRLVANVVTIEGEAKLAALHAEHGGSLRRISIDRLAPWFQNVAHANPVYYAIMGFRYGFIGTVDSTIDHPVLTALLALVAVNILLGVLTYRLLASGWKLKA